MKDLRIVGSARLNYSLFLWSILSVLVWLAFFPASGFAQNARNSGLATFRLQGALGLGAQWVARQDYGDSRFWRFSPEVVGFVYFPLLRGLYGRTGARIGYAWQQPEMPKSVRLEERDLNLGGEIGVVYDWYVIPSFAVGVFLMRRETSLVTSDPLLGGGENLSHEESLTAFSGQLGLGIPMFGGNLVVEPFFRYLKASADPRLLFSLGVDATVQVF